MNLRITPGPPVRLRFNPYHNLTAPSLVLDPRISYEGISADSEHDIGLSSYLNTAKISLQKHYDENYLC
jgi:hypothetical protein